MTTTAPSMVRDFARRPQDIHAHEPRARVRVKVRPARLQIAGQIAPGPHPKTGEPAKVCEILVPMSRVAELQAMVADPAKLQIARENFEKKQAAWCVDNPANTSPYSPARSYRETFLEDEPPLDLCEVVEEDVPPPMTEAERRAVIVAQGAARSSGKSRKS